MRQYRYRLRLYPNNSQKDFCLVNLGVVDLSITTNILLQAVNLALGGNAQYTRGLILLICVHLVYKLVMPK